MIILDYIYICIELVDGPCYLFHQGEHLGKAHVLLATELPEDIYSDSGRILTFETYTTRSIMDIYKYIQCYRNVTFNCVYAIYIYTCVCNIYIYTLGL